MDKPNGYFVSTPVFDSRNQLPPDLVQAVTLIVCAYYGRSVASIAPMRIERCLDVADEYGLDFAREALEWARLNRQSFGAAMARARTRGGKAGCESAGGFTSEMERKREAVAAKLKTPRDLIGASMMGHRND